MFPQDIETLALAVVQAALRNGVVIATAESCTGGLVAGALTGVAGSSAVVDRGFVTYSNAAKSELISVPAELIQTHGAVSEDVARAMVEGALQHSRATLAVSITGIAGPGGGSETKPVGLVHFALASDDETKHVKKVFAKMDRDGVRHATVLQALKMLRDFAKA